MKPYYVVSDTRVPHSSKYQWFNSMPFDMREGWRTFLTCKTLAHARRQYLRLPVKGRQIDQRGGGQKPKALMWGRMK